MATAEATPGAEWTPHHFAGVLAAERWAAERWAAKRWAAKRWIAERQIAVLSQRVAAPVYLRPLAVAPECLRRRNVPPGCLRPQSVPPVPRCADARYSPEPPPRTVRCRSRRWLRPAMPSADAWAYRSLPPYEIRPTAASATIVRLHSARARSSRADAQRTPFRRRPAREQIRGRSVPRPRARFRRRAPSPNAAVRHRGFAPTMSTRPQAADRVRRSDRASHVCDSYPSSTPCSFGWTHASRIALRGERRWMRASMPFLPASQRLWRRYGSQSRTVTVRSIFIGFRTKPPHRRPQRILVRDIPARARSAHWPGWPARAWP